MFYGWRDVESEHVIQLLGSVRKMFSDPSAWIAHPRAEDASGNEVSPHSSTAVKWSLLGAGERCAETIFADPLCNYVECAMREYLDDISSGKAIHTTNYEDEYNLICLGYDFLQGEREGDQTE